MTFRFFNSLCWRLYTVRLRFAGLQARIQAHFWHNPIVAALKTISAKGGRGDDEQFNRALDLWKLVSTFRPENIVEFGSGLTTVVLALYARDVSASHVSYEENENWAEITRCTLKALGCTPDRVCLVRVVPVKDSSRAYDVEPALDADFIYVDGPSSKVTAGVKGVCSDTIQLWERGARPRAIVIDGRFPTVDAMRAHAAAADYDVLLETHYLMISAPYAAFGRYRRHTVFLRRDG